MSLNELPKAAVKFLISVVFTVVCAHTSVGSPNIDFRLLYHAALLANDAYAGESAIIGKYPGRNAWVSTTGNTNVQFVLLQNDQGRTQAIAVRGTVDDVNWNLDKDTRGVIDQKAGILLHRGFRTVAQTIYQTLKPRLKQGYTVYLTGHSLGGAVATIVGIYLQADGFNIGGIYTFGQPKFTNAAGARAYQNLPVVRVINQNDAVAVLPERTKRDKQHYVHIGPVVNLLSGPYWAYVAPDKVARLSPGSFGRFMAQVSVPDHKMARYIINLRQKQSETREVRFQDRERYVVRRQLGSGIETSLPVKPQYNFNHHD